jgi:hypothetical protein
MSGKSFLLYKDKSEMFDVMDDVQAGRLIKAIFKYETTGEVPDDPMTLILFLSIKPSLDEADIKYERKCKKNAENADKRWNQNNANVCDRMRTQKNDGDTDTNTDTNTNTKKDKSIKPIIPSVDSEPVDNPKPKKPKSKKPEEPKIQYAEYVSLTEREHKKLIDKVGDVGTEFCIEKLNNYKGSSGKKYASDYMTILNWGIERFEEEAKKDPKLKQKHKDGMPHPDGGAWWNDEQHTEIPPKYDTEGNPLHDTS